ncbi:MAG: mechanosensitive ion channel domain-containing protein [Elainellaceae cyanobacterium]
MLERAIQLFEAPLFELGGQPISLLWISKLLLALFVVSIVARLIKQFLKHRLLPKFAIDVGNREAIASLISIGAGAFGYVIVLQATGINLASLAVVIGGLGVGIGFGLQDIAKNLLSGLTILIERKLRVGDFVEFDDIEGYIEEISIRSTVIRTLAGGEVMIPNSQLAEERITNWSYRDFTGRIEIAVGVAYGSDPVLVTETLMEAAYALGEILSKPAPKVIFDGFGDHALNFKLWAWTAHIDRRDILRSELTFTTEYYLRQQGITVPFPQMDLWVRSHGLPLSPSQSKTQEVVQEIQKSGEVSPSAATPSPRNHHAHPNTIRDWLTQISYFQHFNELQLRKLIEMGYRKHLNHADVFVNQGQFAREFCIVLSGAIGAFHESNHQEKQLFTFEAGQYFGELPLMLGLPYPTTMKALSNTVLFLINAEGFERLLRDHPDLANDIAQELARRQEVLDGYHHELKQMGLLNGENENNPVVWIQQRLKDLFARKT